MTPRAWAIAKRRHGGSVGGAMRQGIRRASLRGAVTLDLPVAGSSRVDCLPGVSMSDHSHSHLHGVHSTQRTGSDQHPSVVRDPVCGMTVDPAAGKPSAEHAGRIFHFCGASCRTKFLAAPETYLTAVDPICGMTVDRATA